MVDYFQDAVKKIHPTTDSSESASPVEHPKYQYQRAFALSKDLSDQLVKLSAEQINQIKTQNVLVKRATEAAQQVTTVASSSYGAAQEKVHAVSDIMLQELHKVQVRNMLLVSMGLTLISNTTVAIYYDAPCPASVLLQRHLRAPHHHDFRYFLHSHLF